MDNLISKSIDVIHSGQVPSGAYLACPTLSNVSVLLVRDGTFAAHAMDLWGQHESATRFYDWASGQIVGRAKTIDRCIQAVSSGQEPDRAELLDTRYTPSGEPGREEWPNFQLDGFGTLLGIRGISRAVGKSCRGRGGRPFAC